MISSILLQMFLESISFHLDAVREISQRAYDHNEFYKNKMDEAGVHPRDIAGLSDLRKAYHF